jgi:hypothetical protein
MKKSKFEDPTYVAVRDRKVAYCQLFEGEGNLAGRLCRADLSKFCREFESTFNPDPRIAANLDGRREVLLRIIDHLTLSVEELIKKYGGKVNA